MFNSLYNCNNNNLIILYEMFYKYICAVGGYIGHNNIALKTQKIYARINRCSLDNFIQNNTDINDLKKICNILSNYPSYIIIKLSDITLHNECIKKNLGDELCMLLDKTNICVNDQSDMSILSDIFNFATYPKQYPQIHAKLHEYGYFKKYMKFYTNEFDYYDLCKCKWPLNIFKNVAINDTKTIDSILELINLKEYDSYTLLVQFLAIPCKTDELDNTKLIINLFKKMQISSNICSIKIVDEYEILKVVDINNSFRNNLYKIRELAGINCMSHDIYKFIETKIFVKYIRYVNDGYYISDDKMCNVEQMITLMDEYVPNYTDYYYISLIKSSIAFNSIKFNKILESIDNNYYKSIALSNSHLEPPPKIQISLEPKILMQNSLNTCTTDNYNYIKNLVSKVAFITKKYCNIDCINNNEILLQLFDISYLKRNSESNKVILFTIDIIYIYLKETNLTIQQDDVIVIDKIKTLINSLHISKLAKTVHIDFINNMFENLSLLINHASLEICKELIILLLNNIFRCSCILLLSNNFELHINYKSITLDWITKLNACLEHSGYHIKNDTIANFDNKKPLNIPASIRIIPIGNVFEKMRIAQMQNWCAKMQINYSELKLSSICDNDPATSIGTDTNIFTCPITFDELKEGNIIISVIKCGHKFSFGYMIEWIAIYHNCPLCRGQIIASPANINEGDYETFLLI